jgi:hypothetical protein
MNILGHVPDLDDAVAIVRDLMAALPSGSYLVTADGTNVLDGPAFEEAIGVWNANAPLSYHLRRPEELARFLDGLATAFYSDFAIFRRTASLDDHALDRTSTRL